MNIVKPVGKFLRRNGSLLLTIGASAGVIATSYFTAKSALKADKILNDIPEDKLKALTTKKIIAKTYIPPVASGAVTIACIVGAHLMNKKIQAGLIAAYSVVNSTFQMYKSKLTVEEEMYVEKAVDEERINAEIKKLLDERPGEEYELWIDDYRKHPFWARKSDILLGKDEINRNLNDPNWSRHWGTDSLETFYSHVKGEPEPQDYLYGWDIDYMSEEWEYFIVDVNWTEETYIDKISGKAIPCNHIYWSIDPIMNYWNYESSWEKLQKEDKNEDSRK